MIRFICSLILVSNFSFAQQVPVTEANEMRAESRLFTLRFVPQDKKAKLFFSGKEMVKIDFEKDHKVLEITALGKGKKEILKFTKDGEAYTIDQLPQWNDSYELEVKTHTKGQIENTRVLIRGKN